VHTRKRERKRELEREKVRERKSERMRPTVVRTRELDLL